MKRSFLFQQTVREGDRTLLVGEMPVKAPPGYAGMGGERIGLVDTVGASARGSPLHLFRLVWSEKKVSKGWKDDWFGMPLYSLSISDHGS